MSPVCLFVYDLAFNLTNGFPSDHREQDICTGNGFSEVSHTYVLGFS